MAEHWNNAVIREMIRSDNTAGGNTVRGFSQLSRSGDIPFTMSADLLDEVRIFDGNDRELLVRWRSVGGGVVARIEIPDDSWTVVASMGDVLGALAELEGADATPEDVVLRLRALGIEDATEPMVCYPAPGC